MDQSGEPVNISSDIDSPLSIRTQRAPEIGVQDAVAAWLNRVNDDIDEDLTGPYGPLWGHNIPVGLLPHMGFHPEQVNEFGVVISTNGTSTISVQEIQDHPVIPDYPHTDPTGIATFVHLTYPFMQEGASKEDIRAGFQKIKSQASICLAPIQFSLTGKNGTKYRETRLRFLSADTRNNGAFHMQFYCSGVRLCGHTDESMQSKCRAYDRVELESFNATTRRLGKPHLGRDVHKLVKKQTEDQYHAWNQAWKRKGESPCLTPQQQPSCFNQPMRLFTRNGVNMVGCPLSSNAEPWHTAWAIPRSQARLDIKYLKALCMSGIRDEEQDTCFWVGDIQQRRDYCGYDHTWGPRKTIRRDCAVTFDIYIPKNTARFPFILIVCRGSHSHHPPYPERRTPTEILNDIKETLQSLDTMNLTTRRFLMMPEYLQLQQKYGKDTLRAIHASLNIEDRITLLIRKQRLFQYPVGCHFAGALREFQFDQQRPVTEQWIRRIIEINSESWLIICCAYTQAVRFMEQEFFEVDLSFKMVQGKIKLFSLSGFDESVNRTECYIYAFINRTSTKIYTRIFSEVFSVISDITGELVKWHHINNGAGIQAITTDMDGAQAHGLGEYLHSLDPSREWDEHLQYVLVFCKVHIQRNFTKQYHNHPASTMLYLLWEAESSAEYRQHIKDLCRAYPELTSWFKAKQKPWIVSALVQSESRVPGISWVYARKHTNLAESTHFEDNNATGRKLTLLGAILRLRKHVFDKAEKREVELRRGVRQRWRDTSNQARLTQQAVRKERVQRRQAEQRLEHPERPFNPLNPFDTSETHPEHMPSTPSAGGASRPSTPAPTAASDHMSSICTEPTEGRSRKRTQGSISTARKDEGARIRRMKDLQREREQLLATKEKMLTAEVQQLRQWIEERQEL